MSAVPPQILRMRAKWRYTGAERPPFAIPPEPGQESVWDYPRPPRIVPEPRRVSVRAGDVVIADTRGAVRVLETAGAPTFYAPMADVDRARLEPGRGSSLCEWKGRASYLSVRTGSALLENAAWTYLEPFPEFGALAGYVSFYPTMLECLVEGERARPQPGGFYGGWVTNEIVGPIKGEPGTESW